MYDILIKRARIIDGTGSPSFWGDVAVQDGKIVGIGNDLGLAREICDADGLTLCPGFIDSHSHGDMMFELDPSFFQEVEQGVTTQIEGMCGISAAPFSETHLDSALEIAATVVDCDFLQSAGCRFDYQQYLDHLEHIRSEHNVFDTNASLRTIDTWDSSILALVRENDDEKFIGIYNFSDQDKVAWINEDDGMYTDLITGHEMEAKGVMIPAFGCFWLCRKK